MAAGGCWWRWWWWPCGDLRTNQKCTSPLHSAAPQQRSSSTPAPPPPASPGQRTRGCHRHSLPHCTCRLTGPWPRDTCATAPRCGLSGVLLGPRARCCAPPRQPPTAVRGAQCCAVHRAWPGVTAATAAVSRVAPQLKITHSPHFVSAGKQGRHCTGQHHTPPGSFINISFLIKYLIYSFSFKFLH